ncbi:MAG: hypothetical protein JXQ96_23265 [Cyclobacteriaceae bacterium]
MTDQTTKNQPDFNVYHVKDLGSGNAHWTQVGAAWANKDGEEDYFAFASLYFLRSFFKLLENLIVCPWIIPV